MITEGMLAISIPITALIVTAIIIKIVSDNRTRQKLIEKGMVDENVKYLFYDKFEQNVPSSLKWGLVLISIGLARLIVRLIPTYYVEEITIGAMFIAAGLALLIFYFIAKSKSEQK